MCDNDGNKIGKILQDHKTFHNGGQLKHFVSNFTKISGLMKMLDTRNMHCKYGGFNNTLFIKIGSKNQSTNTYEKPR